MTSLEDMLVRELNGFGIDCSPTQAQLLIKHLELVIEKNKEVNLARVDSLDKGVYLHVIDSLLCVPAVRAYADDPAILDLGSGGGYPGIPLAIMGCGTVTLLDSIAKKIAALQSFIKELGIENTCSAVCCRSEELATQEPNSFDIVVARAVAQSNVLIELSAPLLKTGGILIALKANPSDDELAIADKAASLCGMSYVSRETFELPNDLGHREIICFKKSGEPSLKLPRRNGMATKRPLGI